MLLLIKEQDQSILMLLKVLFIVKKIDSKILFYYLFLFNLIRFLGLKKFAEQNKAIAHFVKSRKKYYIFRPI